MYGDNAAAIGLAHGTTTSSWRTRHSRIRSSLLKEALDEKQAIHGGPWKLIHLKGTELVADGCTKPLNGQAFSRFLEDLGLPRGDSDGEEHQVSNATSTKENSGGGGGFAAIKALVIGSALLSSAKGASEENDDDIDDTPLLVTGTVLMALGAIYAGQVIHSASRYCLRRWCGPETAAGRSSKERMVNRRVAIRAFWWCRTMSGRRKHCTSGRVNLCPRRGRNSRALVPFALHHRVPRHLGICSLRFISDFDGTIGLEQPRALAI